MEREYTLDTFATSEILTESSVVTDHVKTKSSTIIEFTHD